MSREYILRRRAAVRAYRDQQRWNLENPSLRRPVTSIALGVGRVTSPRTIHRWAEEGTNQATLRRNLSRRGRHPLLSELQKSLVIGHAIHRRSEHKPVHRAHLVDFCRDYLNIKIAPQRISDLLKGAGWSCQKPMSRVSGLTDAMKLVKELRELEYPPERLYAMGETGLWSTTTEPRTYNPHGSGNTIVKETGVCFRDAMLGIVRGDGTKLKPFIIKGEYSNAVKGSGRGPMPGVKPVRSINSDNLVPWIEEFMQSVSYPSVLLLDRASVVKSKRTISEIESYKFEDGRQAVKVMLLPPKTAFLLSPLDMGVFAEFKRYYYRYDRSNFDLKVFAANQAWSSLSAENIRSYFNHCGLLRGQALEIIEKSFRKQVAGSVVKDHQRICEVYDAWRSGVLQVPGTNEARRLELSPPIQLPSG